MPFDPETFLEDMKLENKILSAEIELERSVVYALLHKAQEIDNAALRDEVNKYYPSPRLERNNTILTGQIYIPTSPPNVDIDWNIQRARTSWSPSWFLERLAPGGEMDYKRGKGNKIYEDFGNFNYGAVARGFGFSEETALRAAGLVQILVDSSIMLKTSVEKTKKYIADHGLDFLGGEPYGDQKQDQEMIKQGFRYYDEIYLKKEVGKDPFEDFKERQAVQNKIAKEEWNSFFQLIDNVKNIIMR